MKTEQEYAEMLIEQYYNVFRPQSITVGYAINDVQNTIELINTMPSDIAVHYLTYYNNVLNILKAKL